MREIKFRGKRQDIAWKYGYLTSISKPHDDDLIAIKPLDEEYITYGVNPESVGEYTGLKDKNGIEIYEGDIVNLIPEGYAIVPAVVQWSNKELRWVCFRPETDTGSYLTSDSEVEVIGNIYENPELLEGDN